MSSLVLKGIFLMTLAIQVVFALVAVIRVVECGVSLLLS